MCSGPGFTPALCPDRKAVAPEGAPLSVGTTIPDRKETRMHAEVRGRNRNYRVWTPDQGQLAHTVPMYDQEGTLVEMLVVGSPPDKGGVKMVECYGGPFTTVDEAIDYARYLGYAEVKVIKPMTKQEALAKARAARSRQE